MVFRMFEPVVPVNTGTSVTGVGWVEVSPVTDANPVDSRGAQTHEMTIAQYTSRGISAGRWWAYVGSGGFPFFLGPPVIHCPSPQAKWKMQFHLLLFG